MLCLGAHAQTNRYVRDGNKLYEQRKYKEAAADYQKALQKNPNYVPGLFNLGNSLYQQKQFDAARKVLSATAKKTNDKGGKAGANYNIGNTYMAQQKWEDAIDAYKQALRNNPQDADAKYNLSYAREMMKKQQQNNDKNKDKNKDKNQDKDQKNKDQQNKDNKDNKDQQNKDQQNKDNKDQQNKDQQNKDQQNKDQQDQQHAQPQPSKLSKDEADRILNALQQDEKKLQDKMQKAKGVPVKTEKDW
jgi:tetratricopeptide (TPR) repeat protein